MREIEVTDRSPFYLARAKAKREGRRQRNLRLYGATASEPHTIVETVDYEAMKASELLMHAKRRGLKATTKTRKADLIKLLSES